MLKKRFCRLLLLFMVLGVSKTLCQPVIRIAKEGFDSVYFDFKEFALYSKTSGYDNRFKTVKQCTIQYTSKKMSGKTVTNKNHLPGNIHRLVYKSWQKKIEINITGIVLKADSLNPAERNCPPIRLMVIKKIGLMRFLYGRWRAIPLPFPACYIKSFEQVPAE